MKKIKKKKKNWTMITVIFLVVLVIICTYFFSKSNNKMTKKTEIGNNSSSQEIVEYILNIKSYELKIEVEIQSNKNKNRYIIKQKNNNEEEVQEVIEPSNIAGVKLIKKGNTLKLENTKLNLTSIFENYEYLADNNLDLSSFIKDYLKNEKSCWEEKDGMIEMNTENNKMKKTLYINKEEAKLEKMEIKDNNKKNIIYIRYSEITVNT
ncbi:MAG: hypothetical protein HUJ68_03755 [Clostridia bacterium]|nr:hypothetical protein [Clostridia bacterium]